MRRKRRQGRRGWRWRGRAAADNRATMMTTRAEVTTTTAMDCMVSCAFEQISARYLQISADICRYLQISAQISGHASRYLLPLEDISHMNYYKL
jgi:hypothetical protein